MVPHLVKPLQFVVFVCLVSTGWSQHSKVLGAGGAWVVDYQLKGSGFDLLPDPRWRVSEFHVGHIDRKCQLNGKDSQTVDCIWKVWAQGTVALGFLFSPPFWPWGHSWSIALKFNWRLWIFLPERKICVWSQSSKLTIIPRRRCWWGLGNPWRQAIFGVKIWAESEINRLLLVYLYCSFPR